MAHERIFFKLNLKTRKNSVRNWNEVWEKFPKEQMLKKKSENTAGRCYCKLRTFIYLFHFIIIEARYSLCIWFGDFGIGYWEYANVGLFTVESREGSWYMWSSIQIFKNRMGICSQDWISVKKISLKCKHILIFKIDLQNY